MSSRRSGDERPDALRDDAAARRLAQIAAAVASGGEGTRPDWWADHTRVAGVEPAEPAAAPSPPALPPALPVAGRHAARRRRPLPVPQWAGRALSLSPAHVAVVAVAVALGLAVTTWWVARDQPVSAGGVPAAGEVAAPLLAVGSPAAPSGAAGPASAEGGTVTVDVAGKVRRPGIVVLDEGARVTDALEAAGGARRGVELASINLARVLVDGEQIVVGAPAGPAPLPPGAAGGGAASAGPLVNLNLATQAELETLSGVGPVTAQAIIAWREQRGGFTSVDELLEVDGIGEKTLAQLAPQVTV